jgi:SNF2 family DNA or RNA helicase
MININIARANKLNGDYSLYVTFDFDMRIVNVIREFSSKFWYADEKKWELPFNKLGDFISKVTWSDINITGEYITLEKPKAEIPSGFEFKTNPYEHQIAGFNFGLTNDRWLLGDEMGLGKTKQVVDIAVAKKLQKGYKHCLIICGVNGLKWNWKNEISVHSDESGYILGQKIKKDGTITIGSNQDKYNDIINLHGNDNYFIITNIESLRDEEIAKALKSACECGLIGMIAFDECHKAKNPQSDQGKGILKLQAETMIAMTGTPLMNQPFDLFIILKWLGYEKHAFGSFKHHYAEYGGYGGYEVIGYKNLDELQDRLNEIMLRRKKEEVLDLPEKTYINEYVDMSPKQKKVYDEVTSEIKANIDQIKMANNPLAELIRMRQATGYTGILSSTIKESAKLDRMVEIVDEAVANGKKVVIFSNWTQMTHEIFKRVGTQYITGVITGETNDADRQTIVNEFQNNDAVKVIIGTSGAMGTGLTLTAGTVEIFMDEPWNMALKEQCVDRCHRIGQKSNITIYTMMCKNTIDERIHNLVEKKGVMADALVDGKLTKENAKELLDYLLS